MKNLMIGLILFSLLLATPVTFAQRRCGNFTHRHGNVIHTHYSCIGDKHKHGRSFWNKHRDKLTVAGGAGAGAIVGGIAGGGKGAAIGSIIGGGGAAIYTYGIRKHRKRARYPYPIRCDHC